MIRIITYLIVSIFGIIVSFGQIKSEEINLNNGAIELPGTLTYSQEKVPLIIWVHGSGGVDRNGNQPNYIQQFRAEINKNNIAFFSFDKRTANPKNKPYLKDILILDFVSDVEKFVTHFKDDKRFTEIILVGHSQGSLIAMLALKNVDKFISIAGAGETVDKTLTRQITKQNAELGKLTAKYLKELKETGEIKEVNPFLQSLFAKPNQPFLKNWVEINPIEEIKKVTIPTLIINGDKDIQVEIADAENLKNAKPTAQFAIIKNMNHVLKQIDKNEDNLVSYYSPDFPLSEKLILTIVEFVKK
jgi:hypothetical protein